MAKYRKLLKNRDFVFYSAGQAFSQFADRLVQIILIGFVYKRFPGSAFQLAKIFFFTVIPAFFISPIAGVYVDRWDRRTVMIVSDMLRGLLILTVPLFFIHGQSVVPIYVIIFLIFASACFFLPARLAVMPSLVAKEDLFLANSASSITWVASGIAGFSLGGLMVEWAGIKTSLYVNALVYGFSAASFFLLARSMKKTGGRESAGVTTAFHDFKEGLKALLLDRKIRFVVGIFFTLSALIGVIYVVGVVFIQESLRSMTKHIGLFGMYLFLGVLVGSYVYGKIGGKLPRKKSIFASFIFTGLFISAFALGLRMTGSVWVGGALTFLMGLSVSPIYVVANTMIHESAESNLRGRIFSSVGIVMNFAFLSFMFVSSMLAERVDMLYILVGCGAIFVLIGLVSFFFRNSRPH